MNRCAQNCNENKCTLHFCGSSLFLPEGIVASRRRNWLALYLIKHKANQELKVLLHEVLTSALCEWSASRPGRFSPAKRTSTPIG
jgi:hypothetical protein